MKIQDRVMKLYSSVAVKGFKPVKILLGPAEIKELNTLERTPAGKEEANLCCGLPFEARSTRGITIEAEDENSTKTKKFKEPVKRKKK